MGNYFATRRTKTFKKRIPFSGSALLYLINNKFRKINIFDK